MYIYGWFMLIYGRNQHNIVKQLFSIKKKKENRVELREEVPIQRMSPCGENWHLNNFPYPLNGFSFI